jgi:hypothetical protein
VLCTCCIERLETPSNFFLFRIPDAEDTHLLESLFYFVDELTASAIRCLRRKSKRDVFPW